MDHIAHDDDADRLRASRGVGGDDGRSDESELHRGGGAPGDDGDRDARSSRRRRAAISAVLVVLSAAAVALGASVLAASGEARRERRHQSAVAASSPSVATVALGDGGTDPTSPKSATDGLGNVVCVDEGSCDAARMDLGVPYYYRGDFSPYYGCMVKDEIAFFGRGGTREQLETPSDGEYVRIWCGTQSSPKVDDGSVDLPDYLQDNLRPASDGKRRKRKG
mmetsp:Transcript_18317/g.40766  ORF Transcript_18317/g.40766 Transcript_18317/m.40766 type:complete len:222 (-) Transcript_18317:56-721(-)